MKTILSSRTHHYLAVFSVFLTMMTLIAGIVGCNGDGHVESHTLTISSTSGGSVTQPEEETSTHDQGTVVSLVAEPEEGYMFVNWTGEVDTVADVNDATTTITMSDDYQIAANFAPVTSAMTLSDWYDLDAVREDLNGDYLLMNDLDSATAGYQELASPAANQGKGWNPIGTPDEPFLGTLDGQGHEVRDMVIKRPARNYTGLFGAIGVGFRPGGAIGTKGVVENLGVVNAEVTGDWNVGGVVGVKFDTGAVTNCYFTGDVTGSDHVGGLMGFNYGTLSDSYATGSVTGDGSVGGLVGIQGVLGVVNDCYSASTATGNLNVGGLLGQNGGTVINSYFTGSVTGGSNVGGLAGSQAFSGTVISDCMISNCYSTGTVAGNLRVGGLVGYSYNSMVSDSYATGSVTGEEEVGGLVGFNDGTVSNSFWDTRASGQSTSAGGTGRTTAEMRSITTFSGAAWNIVGVANPDARNPSYIWNIVDGQPYPFLSWQSV